MVEEYLTRLFSLRGQTIVVIGGTGELGGALAAGMARAGARLVIAGRNQQRGQARVAEIESLGGVATFAECDTTSREATEQLAAGLWAEYGQVDGLVNCAGVNSPTPLFEIGDEEFQRIVDTNLRAVLIATQSFGKRMVEGGGGAILNIGSVTSFRPLSRVYTYSATKAGVLSLTQNTARELAPHGVRVNCLCPGFFPAEQNRKILDSKRVEDIIRHTPCGRMGDSEELIGAALLLMAPVAGSFITGAAIYVDGGFTAMTI